MRQIKYIIFIIALSIYAYLHISMNGDTELISLYNGAVFNNNLLLYMRLFFLFLCYSLYIYNEFETYIYDYGTYIAVREQSRSKLLQRLSLRLIKLILQIEVIKIVCYVSLMLLMKGNIAVSNPMELVKILVLELLSYFLMLYVQVLFEIYFSGKIALGISLSYFILCINISDIVANSKSITNKLNLLIIPNLTMKARVDSLVKGNQGYCLVVLILILSMVIIYQLSKRMFFKKDLLGTE